MSKRLSFSQAFPKHHSKFGQRTHFVEQIYNGIYSIHDWSPAYESDMQYVLHLDPTINKIKGQTIRKGHRWKVGDKFTPFVWAGTPYRSQHIVIAEDIEIKRIYNVYIKRTKDEFHFFLNGQLMTYVDIYDIALADGFTNAFDFMEWFPVVRQAYNAFYGQMLVWSNIEYNVPPIKLNVYEYDISQVSHGHWKIELTVEVDNDFKDITHITTANVSIDAKDKATLTKECLLHNNLNPDLYDLDHIGLPF